MPRSQPRIIQNQLLACLPPDALAAMLPRLNLVALIPRQPIYAAGVEMEAVYFPTAGMISLVASLDDGMQAEVGVIGREGMLGVSILSGVATSFTDAMVQMPGAAWRMTAADLGRELRCNPPLRPLLSRYGEALQAQIMQTAACNVLHTLEQRLVRWLLMVQDRGDGDELALTQDFMAVMLGVQRPTLTLAAGVLQRAGLIRYARGHLTVLDRPGLEAACCECYGAVRQRFAVLLGGGEPKDTTVGANGGRLARVVVS